MSRPNRPLTHKQLAFAQAYAGDGVAAARAAGYTGTPASLATIASRLLHDPRVAAIIRERSRASSSPQSSPPSSEPAASSPPPSNPNGGEVNAPRPPLEPLEVLRELAADPTVHPSARVAAARSLAHAERQAAPPGDPFAALRAKVNELTKARLERERETGRCAYCGGPLRRGRR